MANLQEVVKLFIQHTGRTDLLLSSDANMETDLLTGGDMEGTFTAGVAAGWTISGSNWSGSEETSDRYNGSKAQRLAFSGTSSLTRSFTYGSNLTLTAGKIYRLSFAYKVLDGTMALCGLYDNSNLLIPYTDVFEDNTVGDWVTRTFEFIPTTTGTTFRVVFSFYNSGTTGEFLIDDVHFYEVTGGVDARWYIRQACDFLDKQQEHPQRIATHVENITEGDYFVDLLNCRAVDRVWIKQSGEDRSRLTQATFDYILENYLDRLADTTTGTPTYYAVVDPRQAPSQVGDTLNTVDAEWLISGTSEDTTRVVIMPPADGDYTVVVRGLFSASTLTNDADSNWWTINQPWLVVWTAKFILEGALRSTQGMQDLLAFIQPYLVGIDKDLVELYMPDSLEMEG